MDSSLNERLAALSRRRPGRVASRGNAPAAGPGGESAGTPAPAPPGLTSPALTPTAGRRRKKPPPLAAILPGEEIHTASGSCWRHERRLSQWPGADPALPSRLECILSAPPPADLHGDRALGLWRECGLSGGIFLDLETTGLAATPVFLAGLLSMQDGEMTFRLYMARDYAEEKPLLEALAEEISRRPVTVTYNGKSYDLPYLRERIGRLRVTDPGALAVFDLLHPARRRWARRLPDCRLQTLEWHLCRRKRAGDIAGSDIPAAYHDFVRTRDPRLLLRIFNHNIIDLYTLAEITGHVLSTAPDHPGTARMLRKC